MEFPRYLGDFRNKTVIIEMLRFLSRKYRYQGTEESANWLCPMHSGRTLVTKLSGLAFR